MPDEVVDPFAKPNDTTGIPKWVIPGETAPPEVVQEIVDLTENIQQEAKVEEVSLLEQLRLKMLEAKGDRDHHDIGLSDEYWTALDAFKREYNKVNNP